MKERMQYSEAKELVEECKRAFFKPIEKLGIRVEEGEPDLDGKPFTKERVERIHREIETGAWGILRDRFEIIEEPTS